MSKKQEPTMKPILEDLEVPVLPLAPDEGCVQDEKGRTWRIRTGVHAGGGEGMSQTDRSN